MNDMKKFIAAAAIFAAAFPLSVTAAQGADGRALEAISSVASPHAFPVILERLERSISSNGMGLVARASASAGAAARGVKIPGNAVLMVFRNDYAVRMLDASVPAGIEAPLRIYVTEEADGSTRVAYRPPSAVFRPYGVPALDALAGELDPVFRKIIEEAAAP